MSTISTVGDTPHAYAEPNAQAAFRHFLAAVLGYRRAAHDGLAAAWTYRDLTRRGATHEEAVAKVFHQHLSVP